VITDNYIVYLRFRLRRQHQGVPVSHTRNGLTIRYDYTTNVMSTISFHGETDFYEYSGRIRMDHGSDRVEKIKEFGDSQKFLFLRKALARIWLLAFPFNTR
jgi:hypothetical protein